MPEDTTPAVAVREAEAAARRFYAILAAGDEGSVEQALDPSWEQIPQGAHTSAGVAGYRETIAFLKAAFSDLSITVEDVLVEGDRVAIRTVTRATHTGNPVLGIPATNRPIELAASDFHQVQDGRIVRTWHLEDWLGLAFQLGATLSVDSPPNGRTDTKKI
jgi:predicted ester cyclase